MKLTTKGRYAVTAMLDLAMHHDGGPVPLADISRRQAISLSYLEQLFTRLRRRGLVRSTRGPGGGYSLDRPPEAVTVADVITAVDEAVDTTRCRGEANCQDGRRCLTHELWTDLAAQIYGFLRGITLGQLMARQEVQEVAARQDGLLHGREEDSPTGPLDVRPAR
ncbi:MAG: Fe-S cluster assembly transcription factor [Gammaproteobacteria bacterium]|nr:Fe-S cluster assembly transcription factor [Gammaproteobacteria bacterium]